MGTERETLTYEDFGRAARELAQQVADDGLDVKNLYVMNVEFYTGVDERLELPVILPPNLDQVDLTGAKVLIADDVADTGKTLELVREFCAGHVAEVRSAVIYEKPRSLVKCSYVWQRTDAWIDFPWSTLPPVVDRRSR